MQPKELAQLLGVTPNTIRRWCAEFHKYLTPTAHPPKGKPRVLAEHDCRVLHYVAAARDTGQPMETIIARLEAMLDDDWRDLPEVPAEWAQAGETMPVTLAASKAYDIAQVAVLQRELEYTSRQLEDARQRIETLEAELDTLNTSHEATEAAKHALELELATARGEVDTLRARLESYRLAYSFGRDQPVNIGLIVVVVALVAVALVLIVLIVVRLVM